MNRQSFRKKAVQASAWYFRFASFILSLIMGFSSALYLTTSKEALAVSQVAFGESIDSVDYKAVMNEPSTQNGSIGVSLSKNELRAKKLYPGGIPFGIKFITEGVLIVGFCDFKNSGKTVNPSSAAGLRMGDRIISVNSRVLSSAEELTRIVEQSGGKPLNIVYTRDGNKKTTVL